jgi:hypothetical protein
VRWRFELRDVSGTPLVIVGDTTAGTGTASSGAPESVAASILERIRASLREATACDHATTLCARAAAPPNI